jgi:alkyl hydroperoxide reductase subunit AhpF
MALISDRDKEAIRNHFDESLASDVEILLFTERPSPIIIPGRQQCETCDQTEELLGEVAGLSDKLHLRVREMSKAEEEAAEHGIDRVPAFVVKGAQRGRVRFFGIPAGYELSAFIQDLVDASRGESGLTPETRQYLASLDKDVNIKVFTTPT